MCQTVKLQNSPKGYITAAEHASSQNLLLIGTILGELYVYSTGQIETEESKVLQTYQLHQPILSIAFFEELCFILHPCSVSTLELCALSSRVGLASIEMKNRAQDTFQMLKVNEDLNILVTVTSHGLITLYNLPDLIVLDESDVGCKIQVFDLYLYYLVVATDQLSNRIFDVSAKKLIELKTQDSGFKYPVTTDLKILHTIENVFQPPHHLIYAQSGLEGKVSVVTTKVELQTDPTVTLNTAAKSAPISESITNPSGIAILSDPQRFIFRAHRTTLSDSKVLISPIYSLNMVGDNLITSGYGGGSNNNETRNQASIEGSLCFWDIEKRRRLKLCKGFPQSIVKTVSWDTSDQHIVVCCCSDDTFKNMAPGDTFSPRESSIVIMVLSKE